MESESKQPSTTKVSPRQIICFILALLFAVVMAIMALTNRSSSTGVWFRATVYPLFLFFLIWVIYDAQVRLSGILGFLTGLAAILLTGIIFHPAAWSIYY